MAEAAAQSETGPPPQWVLRVLSGAQAGAEIALATDRYTLGSGAECAIVLSGEGIEARHLEAFFADGHLSILRSAGETFVSGARVDGTLLDIEPLQLILVGGTALAYGQTAGVWPGAEEVAEALKAREAQAQAAEAGAEGVQEAASAAAPAARSGGRGSWALGACLLLLFPVSLALLAASVMPGGLPGAGWLPSGGGNAAGAGAKAGAKAEAQIPPEVSAQIFGDPAFAHVHWIGRAAGERRAPILRGFVEREADLNRLIALGSGYGAEFQLVSLDKLRRSLEVLLPLYGPSMFYEISPTQKDTVRLRIEGMVRAQAQIAALRQTLRRDLPAISQIEMNVIAQARAAAIVERALRRQAAFGGLMISVQDLQVTISGTLLGNFRERWSRMEAALPALLPRGVVVRRAIGFGPEFTGRVESIVIGARPAARIAGGAAGEQRRYREGDRLPGGFVLEKIQPDGLRLKDGGGSYFYPLTP